MSQIAPVRGRPLDVPLTPEELEAAVPLDLGAVEESSSIIPGDGGALYGVRDGRVRELTPEVAANPEMFGYRPATPEEVEAFRKSQEPVPVGRQIGAFAEGALSGLTFGASDWLERGIGEATGAEAFSPEAMRERSDLGAHTAGQVVGTLTPMLVPGVGAALAGKAAAQGAAKVALATAPGFAARAGKAAEGLVKVGIDTAGKRIAGAAARTAVAGATEGALFGAGELVHEAAIEDPALTGEHAFAVVAAGMLLGGGLGGFVGGAAGAGKEILGKMAGWIGRQEGAANIRAAGGTMSTIKQLANARGIDNVDRFGRELYDYGIVTGKWNTPQTVYDKAQKVIESGSRMANEIAAQADSLPNAPTWTFPQLRAQFEPPIVNALSADGATIGLAAKFTAKMDEFALAYGDKPFGFSKLNKIKQSVGELVKWQSAAMDAFDQQLSMPFKRVYGAIRTELEDGLERAGIGSAAWKEAMHRQSVGLTAQDIATYGIERFAGNSPVPLTGMLGGIGGAVYSGLGGGAAGTAVATLLRRQEGTILGSMARSLGSPRATAAGVAEAKTLPEAIVALQQISSTAQKKIESGAAAALKRAGRTATAALAGHLHRLTEDDYHDAVAAIRAARSPERMEVANDDGMSESAPRTAAARATSFARAASFLASKAPAVERPMLAREPTVSQTALARFNRYYAAIQEPTVVFDLMAQGRLLPEHVEALAAVYPGIYRQVLGAVGGQLAELGERPDAQTRLMLSVLFQQDMDGQLSNMAQSQQFWSVLNNPVPQGPPGAAASAGASQMKKEGTTAERMASFTGKQGLGSRRV